MDFEQHIQTLRASLDCLEQELRTNIQKNIEYSREIIELKETIEDLKAASVHDNKLISQLSHPKRRSSFFSWY